MKIEVSGCELRVRSLTRNPQPETQNLLCQTSNIALIRRRDGVGGQGSGVGEEWTKVSFFSPTPDPRPPTPLLRCEPRASRGHRRSDSGFDGLGDGCLRRRIADSACTDCAWRCD